MIDREIMSKRLKEAFELLRYKGLINSMSDLSKALGRDRSLISAALANRGRVMTAGLLERVADAFPDILNKEYLLTGKGSLEKLHGDAAFAGIPIPVDRDEPQFREVPYVPVEACASFLSSLDSNDVHELETLPVYLTSDEQNRMDRLFVFEVFGDSMEPGIPSRAKILTEQIPASSWHYASGVVVAVYDTTVTLKRIAENDLSTGNSILLAADNEKHGKMRVALADLRGLFKAIRIISAPIY